MPYDAQALYTHLISSQETTLTREQQLTELWEKTHAKGGPKTGERKYRKAVADDVFSSMSIEDQAKVDLAMMYGTLTLGTPWKIAMLQRIFSVLYNGGLLVRHEKAWKLWSDTKMPIGSALCHGGRVLIQLPTIPDNQNQDGFWKWLWGGQNPQSRWAATHGVEISTTPELLPSSRKKYVKEIKVGFFSSITRLWAGATNKGIGRQYGVNIAGGGQGKINPWSGNQIKEDGEHGHLYLHYVRPRANRFGAVMVAIEDSAPVDRREHRPLSEGKPSHVFSVGQSGHQHKFGGAGTYSFSGGKKFTNLAQSEPARVLPVRKKKNKYDYVDTMFIDLATFPKDYEMFVLNDVKFKPEWLGHPGVPPHPRTA